MDFTPEQTAAIQGIVKTALDASMKESIAALFTDITAYVDERTVVQPPSQPEESVSVSTRLQEVERQLQSEKDARAKELRDRNRVVYQDAIREALSEQGITAKTAVELLTNRTFDTAIFDGDSILTKDGKTISELVSGFAETDGSDFRPKAQSMGTTAGSTEQKSDKPSLDTDLSAFLTW